MLKTAFSPRQQLQQQQLQQQQLQQMDEERLQYEGSTFGTPVLWALLLDLLRSQVTPLAVSTYMIPLTLALVSFLHLLRSQLAPLVDPLILTRIYDPSHPCPCPVA